MTTHLFSLHYVRLEKAIYFLAEEFHGRGVSPINENNQPRSWVARLKASVFCNQDCFDIHRDELSEEHR